MTSKESLRVIARDMFLACGAARAMADWVDRAEDWRVLSFRAPAGLVRLRVDSAALLNEWRRLWDPFQEDGNPELEITVRTGSPPLLPTHSRIAPGFAALGAATSPRDELMGYQRPGLSAWYWRRRRRLVACVAEATTLLPSELGKPFQLPLLTWLADQGLFVFHGAIMARAGRGLLLAGGENAGKSTVLTAGLLSDWDFVADDYVELSRQSGGVRAQSLYASIWLEKGHARRFPRLPPLLFSHRDPKSLLRVTDFLPSERILRQALLAMAVFPVLRGQGTSLLRPLSAAQGLRRWLPSSFYQIPGRQDQAKLDLAADFLRQVPCYELIIGANVQDIPPLLERLVA